MKKWFMIGGAVAPFCLLLVVILLLICMFGGVKMKEEANNPMGGAYVCSPTGEIHKEMWEAAFSQAGVLKDKGNKYIEVAKKQGIDPVLFAAISFHETAWGKSQAVTTKNNPGGLMTSSGLMSFATLDDGLEAMGVTLHNRILVDGKITIEDLGSVYAPVGASNDPSGLNVYWVPTVKEIAAKLGGLTMNCTLSGAELPDGTPYFPIVMEEMVKYEGRPYVWGGSNPSQGFDCSGLVQWAFAKAGIQLPRTAAEQFNVVVPISAEEAKPGDLVFFYGTYGAPSHVSHVGVFTGNGKMYNANGSGVGYSDITTGYWAEHRPTFGRIIGRSG